jgi:hypothetical protein
MSGTSGESQGPRKNGFLFPRWTNYIPHAIGAVTPILLGGVTFVIWYWFSPSFTDQGYQPKQPVPFSHQLHAGQMGMDCRYCHSTVEKASYAAIPATEVCMNCHSLVKKDSPKLAPVRESWNTGSAVEWKKVHMLPDYAYFHHSVHVAAGVGCVSCHGRIDQMAVVAQDKPLSMGWCLECHRNPTPNLRPVSEVTNMAYDAKAAGYDPASDPLRTRPVNPPEHCSGCHR